MPAQPAAARTTVAYWHTSYREPCEHGPTTPHDAICAAHGLLTAAAGTNGWPADLNDLGALRLRAYTATNWFDVLEVVDWHTKTGPAGRGVDYTLVIDNGGQPVTITTDTIAFLGDA